MTEAASLPLVALTAWQALVERVHCSPGQKVLIHAGAGGLGSIAVQLATALGAHVATTVSTAKVDLAEDLGADFVVDYRPQDNFRLNPFLRLAMTAIGFTTRRGVTYSFLFVKAGASSCANSPPHRRRQDPPRRRPRLPVRRHPPGHEVRREGPREGWESRRLHDVSAGPAQPDAEAAGT